MRGTRLALEWEEHAGEESDGFFSLSATIGTTVSEQVVGETSPEVPAGASGRWDFEIPVPPDAFPSRCTASSRITWRVVAKVDRPLRRDEKCEVEVQVLSPQDLPGEPST